MNYATTLGKTQAMSHAGDCSEAVADASLTVHAGLCELQNTPGEDGVEDAATTEPSSRAVGPALPALVVPG